MDVELIASVISLIVFYLIILAVGVASTIWFRRKYRIDGNSFDLQLVAGRKLGPVVGFLTMSATLVGGGFLNGTSESIVTSGLVWTLAPFGICIGLIIGGIIFAPTMRRKCYKTMLDPLEEKYGPDVTAVIYTASLFGDIFWSAAILAALGSTMSVVIGMSTFISVIISAAVAIVYTLIGQMVSVAYTDIAELILMALGLIVTTPFAMTHPDIRPRLSMEFSNSTISTPWLGTLDSTMAGFWADLAIAMTLGSIPWQSYFQRVLSVDSVQSSRLFSIAAGFSALLFAVPPICIGVVGSVADWNSTGIPAALYNDKSITLPLVIRQFTPTPVAILGLGAVSAAVMSSTDSCILGSASMFTNHVYKRIRYLILLFVKKVTKSTKPPSKITDLELSIVLKLGIVVVGGIATAVALVTPSFTIYGLFILAADIVFVATFPQLICVLYIPGSNGYGGLIGFILSLFLRLGAGEPIIQLPTVIKFPYYSEEMQLQLFPFRTFSMLVAILCTVVISVISRLILMRVGKCYDILRCVHPAWKLQEYGTENETTGEQKAGSFDSSAKYDASVPFQEFDPQS